MNRKRGQVKHDGGRSGQGVSRQEREALEEACAPRDPDQCVEDLIDWIRECECMFGFKNSLGADFHDARDHALECLEIENPAVAAPRKIRYWIQECIKCYNSILLVYLREVREINLEQSKPSERDIYSALEGLDDPELEEVGNWHHFLYTLRNNLEHRLKRNPDGTSKIHRVGNKEARKAFDLARPWLAKSGATMVARYREHFPECCTDS